MKLEQLLKPLIKTAEAWGDYEEAENLRKLIQKQNELQTQRRCEKRAYEATR
jgi:hypothetical protein